MKVYLDKYGIMPTKAHKTDAGWDLYATETVIVPPSRTSFIEYTSYIHDGLKTVEIGSAVVRTGVHIAIPEGYCGRIASKSGLNFKHGIQAEGLIDAGYRGEIKVKVYNLSDTPFRFSRGDKVTQLVIEPISTEELVETENAEDLGETARADGGFGSTGK